MKDSSISNLQHLVDGAWTAWRFRLGMMDEEAAFLCRDVDRLAL